MMMLVVIVATDHGGILLLPKSEIKVAVAIVKRMLMIRIWSLWKT